MLSNIGIATYFLVKCINQTTAVIGEASTVAEDVLSSIRNTVAFGVQQRLANKFDAKLEIAEMYGIRKGFIVATMVSVIWFVAYTTYSLAFWEGSRLINSGEIGIGALMTTVTSVMIGAFALANVAPGFEAMGGSVGAAYKIFEAINRVPVIDSERDDGEQPNELVGRIEFQNVKFAYPSRPNVPVLDDFNLVIEPGQTVALVGASGSGKSTIIGLLERFYEPIGGTITIDGHNLESLNVKWLRRQLSLVSQEPVLFSCSIYKNIGYGLIGTPYENADEETKSEMIRQACEEANAWEFIKNLTDGLDTEVGERGFLLSGGQKQRIAIARAIVSQPKLLLLDEATSALDTKSEGIVQEALDRALQSRTTIIIAHRLSTIRDADKIVVMSNGKIIETGTHSDLLSRQGAYHLLVQAQNIRATNEKDHSALSDEGSKEQKELYKVDTRATRGSISSLVIKDLERDSYYEPKVITRSTFTLVKSFFTAFTAVIFGAQSAGQMFSYAPSMGKARQAAQSFLQILDIRPEIDSLSTEGQTIENVQGELEFRDVHFRYPTRRNVPVLRGTNFTVKPGQFVALVGPSGCGKSTSISLIEQFYRPLAGQILLDGVDITSLNVSNYRRNIGLVQQEPVLYQGTIRENILMGLGDSDADTIPEEVMFSAARKANIHNFIMSLPDRYETLCGSKGVLLSGGQKQRIAIARALIRDPKVLLLDEATSALDSESEKVVQAALDAAAAGRTTIAVAHRLSTIQNADKICVFDKGRIVEEGTHDQLLQKGGIYSTLVQMQALEGN
ncbi:hypothetical protein DV452_004367 [Geotrichum candidum]|nr:hypothetical protein DV452_004367 [Geotrichum candidum]KAI8135842.1 hypothetical protein DUD61_000467 [Geotrichum candidum]KAI9212771.1 hypothetical protein DS838_002336 [Geotrichum bryndzae]